MALIYGNKTASIIPPKTGIRGLGKCDKNLYKDMFMLPKILATLPIMGSNIAVNKSLQLDKVE